MEKIFEIISERLLKA